MPKKAFKNWFHSLPSDPRYNGLPPKGIVAAVLAVLERMREQGTTRFEDYVTAGKGQIAGATGAKLEKILSRYGENRVFLSEGGRTNRGNHEHIGAMLDAIRTAGFDSLTQESKVDFIDDSQAFVVDRAREYFLLERIKFDYSPVASARDITALILDSAKKRSQHGPVAQHLVGAKLMMRFPDIVFDLHPVAAQDKQLDRCGDFQINDMAFHVTVAPNDGHYKKCAKNVSEGMHTTLLVPDDFLVAARRILKEHVNGPGATAESIESFVGQNIGELSYFKRSNLGSRIADLLDLYNKNVRQVESDKSLQIEIPNAMKRS